MVSARLVRRIVTSCCRKRPTSFHNLRGSIPMIEGLILTHIVQTKAQCPCERIRTAKVHSLFTMNGEQRCACQAVPLFSCVPCGEESGLQMGVIGSISNTHVFPISAVYRATVTVNTIPARRSMSIPTHTHHTDCARLHRETASRFGTATWVCSFSRGDATACRTETGGAAVRS